MASCGAGVCRLRCPNRSGLGGGCVQPGPPHVSAGTAGRRITRTLEQSKPRRQSGASSSDVRADGMF